MYIYIYIYICVCTQIYTYIYIHVCYPRACMYINVYIYVQNCKHAEINTTIIRLYIHIYIHSIYIYTYTPACVEEKETTRKGERERESEFETAYHEKPPIFLAQLRCKMPQNDLGNIEAATVQCSDSSLACGINALQHFLLKHGKTAANLSGTGYEDIKPLIRVYYGPFEAK